MSSLYNILDDYSDKEIKEYLMGIKEFYGSSLFDKLYEYYLPCMPYGVQTCDTGEPDVWILDKLERDL